MLSCSFRTGTTTDNSTTALARGLPDTSIHLAGPRGGEKGELSHRSAARHTPCSEPSGQRNERFKRFTLQGARAAKMMGTYVIQEVFESMGFRGCRKHPHRPVEVQS